MVVYTLEQRWEILRQIDLQKMPILAKKIFFSDEAHFDLCRIWGTENPPVYFENPTHPKRVTVWYGFWFRVIIGPFFFENKQEEIITVNGDTYRVMLHEFLFTKTEKDDIGILALVWCGLNRTALRATQPKLHSMFCALFLRSHYQPQS